MRARASPDLVVSALLVDSSPRQSARVGLRSARSASRSRALLFRSPARALAAAWLWFCGPRSIGDGWLLAWRRGRLLAYQMTKTYARAAGLDWTAVLAQLVVAYDNSFPKEYNGSHIAVRLAND